MVPVIAAEPTLDALLSLEMRTLSLCEPPIVCGAYGRIRKRAIRRLHVGEPRGQAARGIRMMQLKQPDVARADFRSGCGARDPQDLVEITLHARVSRQTP